MREPKLNHSKSSTSPCNLYSTVMSTWNFCGREPLDLERAVQLPQRGAQLRGVLVMDAAYAERTGGFNIFRNIINKYRVRRFHLQSLQGCLKDDRRGFAGPDRTGIDTRLNRKVAEKPKISLEVLNM